jgi:basic amino acid/polyamine antiporter, APA family
VSAEPTAQSASLQKSIGPVQFVAVGFGSIVGTGWVVLLGGWLLHAAPGGAILGILLDGAAMALIAAMYAELGSRFPRTGGEVTYIAAVFGKTCGFIVGWLLTLACLSALTFEGIALGWMFEVLWPPLAGPLLYMNFGEKISLGGLLISLAGCTTIAVLNYRGTHSFIRFQNILTTLFLLIVFVIVGVELCFGSNGNLQPLWHPAGGGSWLIGIAWVFGNAPMMFNSFQSVLQAIEERTQTLSKEVVVRLCILSVLLVMIFYLVIVVAAARATPWAVLAASDLAAAEALAHLPWSRMLETVFLLALAASLLKSWNPVFMSTVRLLFAQAREGMIPTCFGSVNPRTGAPDKGVIIVAVCNFIGIFLGKGALLPIVNAISISIALIYVLTCTAALVMRRRDPNHIGFRVPGGFAVGSLSVAAALGMAVFALLQPARAGQADEFKWALLLSWVLLGLSLYLIRNRRTLSVPRATAAPD